MKRFSMWGPGVLFAICTVIVGVAAEESDIQRSAGGLNELGREQVRDSEGLTAEEKPKTLRTLEYRLDNDMSLEARGVTKVRLMDVQPDKVEFVRLKASLNYVYGSDDNFESATISYGYRKGSVIRGAIIEETADDVILDKAPCESELARITAPYKKQEIGKVKCNKKELSVVTVIQN